MKKLFTFFLMSLVFSLAGFSQIGIGVPAPDASSILDIASTTKGILAPRMTTEQRIAIDSPADGLIVYDITTHSMWFYKTGTWGEVIFSDDSGISPAWLVSGNSGTDSATNFIGTTDGQALIFKTNNVERTRINKNGNVGIGMTQPKTPLHVLIMGNDDQDILTLQRGTDSYLPAGGTTNINFIHEGEEWKSVNCGRLSWEVTDITDKDYNANLRIYSMSEGTLNNTFTLKGDGSVGIGIAEPNEQLEITKNFRIPATSTTAGIIYQGTETLIHSAGSRNFFAGNMTGNLSMTGGNNIVVGYSAFTENTSGSANVAMGYRALQANTEGNYNTAIGYTVLSSGEDGSNNTGVGYDALNNNVSGNNNVALGAGAGYSTTGSGNVFLGNQAGYNEAGSNKLYISNDNSIKPLLLGDFATSPQKLTVFGRLGIGINTTNVFAPSVPLHIAMDAAGDQEMIRLQRQNDVAPGLDMSSIAFYHENSSHGLFNFGQISFHVTDVTPDEAAASIEFWTKGKGDPIEKTVTIGGKGDVDILRTLTVGQFIKAGSQIEGMNSYILNDKQTLIWKEGTASQDTLMVANDMGWKAIQFKPGQAEVMSVQSDGNVGIGTFEPQSPLHIKAGGSDPQEFIRLERVENSEAGENAISFFQQNDTGLQEFGRISFISDFELEPGTGEMHFYVKDKYNDLYDKIKIDFDNVTIKNQVITYGVAFMDAITDAPVGTINSVRNNNIANPVTNIPANSTVDITFSFPGVTYYGTELIIATPATALPAGLIVGYSMVPSDTIVVIRIANITGVDISLPVIHWNVKVMR